MKIGFITYDSREHFKEYENPVPYFGTAPAALLQGFSALEEPEIHVVSCTMQPMVSPAKLAKNIWFHSLHVPHLGWLRTGYQGCIRAVRRRLREIQPDLVHGQGTERYCALSAVLSGYPSVLTIHGNMRLIAKLNRAKPFSFDWIAAHLESWTLPRTKGIVCITTYTQQAVIGLNPVTWIVPNAVDADFFAIQPSTPERNISQILCVGGVCARKNQNAFIRALDPVAARLPFEVIFLGLVDENEPYGAEFRQLVAQRPWCRYDGFADREKLRTLFSQAAMLALPSIEDNCPMVVLEAMAASVPIVAARVGGVPELITDGRNGVLFDPNDPKDMAAAVEGLLRSPDQAAALVQNGRTSAMEKYHPDSIARKHLEIYQEVLHHPKPSGRNATV